MNIIGTNLKTLRLKKNITLEQVAVEINKMYNINISRSIISKWETGKASPMYVHLKRLALFYNVTTDFLLGFNQTQNLKLINSDNNLEAKKKRVRKTKKAQTIETIIELLKDDNFTNNELLNFRDFIQFSLSSKNKNR